jgi:hypothetical protein
LLRVLGLTTRYVSILDVAPLKPDTESLDAFADWNSGTDTGNGWSIPHMNTTIITTASLGQILAKCPSQVSPHDRVTKDRGDTTPLCHRLKSTLPNALIQETSSHPSLNWTTERCAACRWVEDWDYNKMVITRNANDVNKHGLCFKEKRVNSTSPGQTEKTDKNVNGIAEEIKKLHRECH